MLKNDLMHNHFKVRSACRKLICAVNDNPDALCDLEFPEVVMPREYKSDKRIQTFGTMALFSIALTKILGIFH